MEESLRLKIPIFQNLTTTWEAHINLVNKSSLTVGNSVKNKEQKQGENTGLGFHLFISVSVSFAAVICSE